MQKGFVIRYLKNSFSSHCVINIIFSSYYHFIILYSHIHTFQSSYPMLSSFLPTFISYLPTILDYCLPISLSPIISCFFNYYFTSSYFVLSSYLHNFIFLYSPINISHYHPISLSTIFLSSHITVTSYPSV